MSRLTEAEKAAAGVAKRLHSRAYAARRRAYNEARTAALREVDARFPDMAGYGRICQGVRVENAR